MGSHNLAQIQNNINISLTAAPRNVITENCFKKNEMNSNSAGIWLFLVWAMVVAEGYHNTSADVARLLRTHRELEDWQDGEHEPMCKLLCHVLATND